MAFFICLAIILSKNLVKLLSKTKLSRDFFE